MSLLWIISFVIDPFTQGAWRVIGWGVAGAVVGAVFGINQWFLFRLLGERRLAAWAHWWVLATIVGWGIGIAVIVGLGAGEELGFAVAGAVFGIGSGIPQWFVLRPHLKHAEWWGLVNTVAWMAGLAPLALIDLAIGFSLVGVISGCISGGVMIWLLHHPLSENGHPSS